MFLSSKTTFNSKAESTVTVAECHVYLMPTPPSCYPNYALNISYVLTWPIQFLENLNLNKTLPYTRPKSIFV